MQKKRELSFTQKLRIYAENISYVKVIWAFAFILFGTFGNLVVGIVNSYIAAKNAPIISRVEAIESRDIAIEKALVELQSSDTAINRKLDTLLLKLIPDFSSR